jgi:hypothetical protein
MLYGRASLGLKARVLCVFMGVQELDVVPMSVQESFKRVCFEEGCFSKKVCFEEGLL